MFIVQVKSLLDNVDGSRTALSVATEVQNELSGPLLAARVMEPWSFDLVYPNSFDNILPF